MKARILALVALLALAATVVAGAATLKSVRAAGVTVLTGSIGGAAYRIEMPSDWNGTLLLYSHGYVAPGQPNPAHDVGDPAARHTAPMGGRCSRRLPTRSTYWTSSTPDLASRRARSPGATRLAASSPPD